MGFIHVQYYYNPLDYLMCGSGIYETPGLLEYPKEILKDDKFSPIRILIDYTCFELDCTEYSEITKVNKNLIKEKLSKAAELIEKLINVQRFREKKYI